MELREAIRGYKGALVNCWTEQCFPLRSFIVAVLLIQVMSFVGLTLSSGELIYNVIWSGPSGAFFPDFVETLYQSYRLHPYALGGIYPPLVYVLFHIAACYMPGNVNVAMLQAQADGSWGQLSLMPPVGLLAIAFFAASSILLAYVIVKAMRNQSLMAKTFVLWAVFTSAPFLYVIERGNVTLLMVPLLIVFVMHYDSSRSAVRWLSYVCFGVAVCFKLYPVLFGALLLTSQRPLRNAAQCAFVTAVLFFVPFFFLSGGMISIVDMVSNILTQTSNAAHWGPGHELSIGNLLYMIQDLFGVVIPPSLWAMLSGLIFLGALLGGVLLREKWEKLLILTIGVIMFPAFSFHYNALYLTIPLIYYVQSSTSTSRFWQIIVSTAFALCIAPIMVGPVSLLPASGYACVLNLGTVIPSVILLLAFIGLVVKGLSGIAKGKQLLHEV